MKIKDGDLSCPRCDGPMIFHVSHEFWSCTNCQGEFWEDTDRLKEMRDETASNAKKEALRQLTYSHVMSVRASIEPKPYSYVPGTKKRGGSKPGRKRKKHYKKQPVQEYQ